MERDSGSRRQPPWFRGTSPRVSQGLARDGDGSPATPTMRPANAPAPRRGTHAAARLCLLEDSYSNLRVMLRLFHDRGYHADHFTNLDAALESVGRDEYDAIIVSDSMAGGVEACEAAISRLRGGRDPATPGIPILAIARPGDVGRTRRLETLGATHALAELTETGFEVALSSILRRREANAPNAGERDPRVLLLEDSYSLSLVLANALIQAQRRVDHVTSEEQARAALTQHAFETVILSQDDSRGVEACGRLISAAKEAASAANRTTACWVLTDDMSDANFDALTRSGADLVLSKADPVVLGDELVERFARNDASHLREIPPAPGAGRSAPVAAPRVDSDAPVVERVRSTTLHYGAAVVLVAVIGWWAWSAATSPTWVSVVAAQRGNLETTVPVVGSVVSRRQVELTPVHTGQLYLVHVNESELARKGETLATLDNREATIRVRRAEAELYRVRTELTIADKTARMLRATPGMDPTAPAIAEAEAARSVARAKLRIAEQDVQVAQVALDRLSIVAPFAGVVTRSLAVEGKWVEAGEPIFTLADFDAREVALRVPSEVARTLNVGSAVRMRMDDGETHVWYERLTRVDAANNAPSRAGQGEDAVVYASLSDDAPALTMGQRIEARVVSDEVTDTIIVPQQAIVTRDGESYVRVVDDGHALWRRVDVALRNERDVAVRAGLRDGESVIVESLALRDGDRVAVRVATADTRASDTN